ncbi:MAG: hypothetical protein WC413_00870 [Candidatus Nanoarchaeia archaeon]
MNTYLVEFYKKNIMIENSKPHGPYKSNVEAESMLEATKLVLPELVEIGMMSGYNDIWDAKISGPNNEVLEILKEGGWLIDLESGKPLKKETSEKDITDKLN